MKFHITAKECKDIQEFITQARTEIIEEQKRDFLIDDMMAPLYDSNWSLNIPWTGAIGGDVTYEFSPTSLGTVIRVHVMKNTKYEKSKDVTDYNIW